MLCQHIYDRREAGWEGKQGVAKVQVQQSASPPQTGEHSSHDFCFLQELSVSEFKAAVWESSDGKRLVELQWHDQTSLDTDASNAAISIDCFSVLISSWLSSFFSEGLLNV